MIRARFFSCALLGVVLTFASISESHGQFRTLGDEPTVRRNALVIGNGNYHNQPLRNPVNDARAMSAALMARGFNVMLLENATRRATQNAIIKFGERLANGGTGVFYYAGHGLQVRGTNYLVPVDEDISTEASVRFEAISLNAVLEEMSQPRPQRTNIVILDACRNNPYASRYGGSAAGLALVDAPTGFLVAYATAPGRVAIDGDSDNGLYTAEILKAMALPGLDVEDMFKRVRAAVSQKTGQSQVPWEASSLLTDFSFQQPAVRPQSQAAALAEAVAEPRTSATRGGQKTVAASDALEMDFWDSIKESTFAEDYRAYLQAFPNGVFAPLARARAERYEREEKRKAQSEIEEIEVPYVAIADANLHTKPSSKSPKVGKVSSGDKLIATAKVKGKNWFEVETESGRVGYIFGEVIELDSKLKARGGLEIEEIDIPYIALTDANLHQKPSSHSPKTGKVRGGARLNAIGKVKHKNWFEVETDSGSVGFIFGQLIELDPKLKAQARPELEEIEIPYIAIANANLHELPSSHSPKVGKVREGAKLTAIGKVKDKNWFEVETENGRVGYIFGDLMETSLRKRAQNRPEVEEIEIPYVALTTANLHERPSSHSPKVGRVSKGSHLLAIGKVKDSNWFEVETEIGRVGYIFGKLIKVSDELSDPAATAQTATATGRTYGGGPEVEEVERQYVALVNANLRAGPSTESPVVGGVRAGSRLLVTGVVKGRNWLRVETKLGTPAYIFGKLVNKVEIEAAALSTTRSQTARAGFEIEEIERPYVALTSANLHAEPTALSRKIGKIRAGNPLLATGKVKNANWYRIETESGTVGYVFGELIRKASSP